MEKTKLRFKKGDKVIMYRYMNDNNEEETEATGYPHKNWIERKTTLVIRKLETRYGYNVIEPETEETGEARDSELKPVFESWREKFGGKKVKKAKK